MLCFLEGQRIGRVYTEAGSGIHDEGSAGGVAAAICIGCHLPSRNKKIHRPAKVEGSIKGWSPT